MVTTLKLGSITVDVVQKDIKNVHLSVYPPAGKVRISAPLRMKVETIRVFAASKLGWIKEQQKKITRQDRESPREYIERESPPQVQLRHNKMILQVRPAIGPERRQEILDEWYRGQLRAAVQPVIAKWAPLMGVQVERVFVQRMKTKWGSCSRRSASISAEYGPRKKAAGVPVVHGGSRDDAHPGANAQRPVHESYGPPNAELAVLQANVESAACSPRHLGLLIRLKRVA